MSEAFDPYHKWLGIAPRDQPPNHYRLLGIDLFESDPDVITHAADQRMTHVRGFQVGEHGAIAEQILNEISAARLCLLDGKSKSHYDASICSVEAPGGMQAPEQESFSCDDCLELPEVSDDDTLPDDWEARIGAYRQSLRLLETEPPPPHGPVKLDEVVAKVHTGISADCHNTAAHGNRPRGWPKGLLPTVILLAVLLIALLLHRGSDGPKAPTGVTEDAEVTTRESDTVVPETASAPEEAKNDGPAVTGEISKVSASDEPIAHRPKIQRPNEPPPLGYPKLNEPPQSPPPAEHGDDMIASSTTANACLVRGIAYCRKGNLDQAFANLSEAIRLDPRFARPYHNRGFVRMVMGDWEGAISDFDRAIQLNADYALAYHCRGVAHQVLGYSRRAQADFAKAKELGVAIPAWREVSPTRPHWTDGWKQLPAGTAEASMWDLTLEYYRKRAEAKRDKDLP